MDATTKNFVFKWLYTRTGIYWTLHACEEPHTHLHTSEITCWQMLKPSLTTHSLALLKTNGPVMHFPSIIVRGVGVSFLNSFPFISMLEWIILNTLGWEDSSESIFSWLVYNIHSTRRFTRKCWFKCSECQISIYFPKTAFVGVDTWDTNQSWPLVFPMSVILPLN